MDLWRGFEYKVLGYEDGEKEKPKGSRDGAAAMEAAEMVNFRGPAADEEGRAY